MVEEEMRIFRAGWGMGWHTFVCYLNDGEISVFWEYNC